MSLAPLIVIGFLLGIRHALDADHLVAVSTILTRERSVGRAMSIGLLWGVGHSVTILLVGGVIIALQWAVPPRMELFLELPVAAMLIILGIRSIGATIPPRDHDHGSTETAKAHAHLHVHGDYVHTHDHGHGADRHGHDEMDTPLARLDRWLHRVAGYDAIRPVVVGVVHGLAGSAAVALLVLPIVDSIPWAILYLLLFGIGTILGMATVTALISLPLRFASDARWLSGGMAATWAIGLVSIGFGVFMAVDILSKL